MTKPTGLHHLAISTGYMKGQIAFFTAVLGLEVVALYCMHGAPNTWHGFLKLGQDASIALVQNPTIAKTKGEIGRSHAGNPAAPSAPGTMQHLALKVDGEAELLAIRDRIRSRGVNVFGPIDHGFCKSIYFAGPEDLTLEVSTWLGELNPTAWIDPEVVELAGISAEELARFTAPADYQAPVEHLPQPTADPDRPHMNFPEAAYGKMLAMSDETYTERFSETEPPVAVAD
ncbi:MAG: VOC family protein [Alphaproteobacteria bacterium]|nr:VOC family protein [Alphaproteobacteria bacterium]